MSEAADRNSTVWRDVLSYFVRNPRAADTLDGIVRFRVMDELLHRGVLEVSEALERLVAAGLLVREDHPGLEAIYRVPPERLAAARQALDSGLWPGDEEGA